MNQLIFAYYSNPPKDFKWETISDLAQHRPKQGVYLKDIKSCNEYETKSKEQYALEVNFLEKSLINFNQIKNYNDVEIMRSFPKIQEHYQKSVFSPLKAQNNQNFQMASQNYFQLEFDKGFSPSYSPQSPKKNNNNNKNNSNKLMKWIFYFKDEDLRDKWVEDFEIFKNKIKLGELPQRIYSINQNSNLNQSQISDNYSLNMTNIPKLGSYKENSTITTNRNKNQQKKKTIIDLQKVQMDNSGPNQNLTQQTQKTHQFNSEKNVNLQSNINSQIQNSNDLIKSENKQIQNKNIQISKQKDEIGNLTPQKQQTSQLNNKESPQNQSFPHQLEKGENNEPSSYKGKTNYLKKTQKKQQLMQEKLEKKEKERQEEERRKIEQEIKKKQEKIESAYEYRYIQRINKYIQTKKDKTLDYEQKYKLLLKQSIEFYHFLASFQEKAVKASKLLIDDFARRQENKLYIQQSKLMKRASTFQNDKRLQKLHTLNQELGISRLNTELVNNNINNQNQLFQSQQLDSFSNMIQQNQQIKNNDTQESLYQNEFQKLEDQFYYIGENYNMILKIARPEVVKLETPLQSIYKSQNQTNINSIYSDAKCKYLQDTFKIMKIVNNKCLTLKEEQKLFRLQVPLSCLVDFRGFRVLCIAKPPFDYNLVHGPVIDPKKGGFVDYRQEKSINDELKLLGKDLYLKEHSIQGKKLQIEKVQLSVFTEVHRGRGFEDIEQIIQKEGANFEISEESKIEDNLYIEKYNDIIPVNYGLELEIDRNINILPIKKLRFEFLQTLDLNLQEQYQNLQLNTDALECEELNLNLQDGDQFEIAATATKIKMENFKQVVQDLENMDFLPVDSQTLTQILHANGLNIRYLGKLAEEIQLPHIQNLCIQEMVSRAIKKIFRETIADYIENFSNQYVNRNKTDSQENFSPKQGAKKQSNLLRRSQSLQKSLVMQRQTTGLTKITEQIKQEKNERIQQKKIESKQHYFQRLNEGIKNQIIEFLNLIFIENYEHEQFWILILNQVQYDYGYNQEIKKEDLIMGGLLISTIEQCQIIANINLKIFENFKWEKLQRQNFNFEQQNQQRQKQFPLDYTGLLSLNDNEIQSQDKQLLKQNSVQQSQAENGQLSKDKLIQASQLLLDRNKITLTTSEIEQQNEKIFTKNNIIGLKENTEVFTIDILESDKLQSVITELMQQENLKESQNKLVIKGLLIQLSTQKALNLNSYKIAETLNVLAQRLIDIKQYSQAIQYLNEAIDTLKGTLSVQIVYPILNFLQICIKNQELEKKYKKQINDYFNYAHNIIEFNLGANHPLYADLYNQFSRLLVINGHLEQALDLLKSSSICMIRCAGTNHEKNAEIYLLLSDLLKKLDKQYLSIEYYEKSYYIYESKNQESVEMKLKQADIAYYLTEQYKSIGKIELAQKYLKIALEIYMTQEYKYQSKIFDLIQLKISLYWNYKFSPLTVQQLEEWDVLWLFLYRNQIKKNNLNCQIQIVKIILQNYLKQMDNNLKQIVNNLMEKIIIILQNEDFIDQIHDESIKKEALKQLLNIIPNYDHNVNKFIETNILQYKEIIQGEEYDQDKINKSNEILDIFTKLVIIYEVQFFRDSLDIIF